MSQAPRFLGLDQVIELHEESLSAYGGIPGCRDMGMVESALGSAQNAYFYGGGDFFDVSAAYAFHLAQAQAFSDGNKRTAIASALTFLAGNGFAHPPTKDFIRLLYDAMIALAERRMDKSELANIMRDFFRRSP